MGALLLLVVSLAGCQDSGGGDGGVLTATPVDPSGQWTVTDTETRNTCSPGSPVDTRDVLLALSSAQVAWQDEGDVCDASPDFPYANNQITGATHQFVGNDGCTYTESFAGTVQFTENNFSGSYRRTYSRSGVNCTDYPDGCEVRATTAGARCEGCYGGCL
jgi:hypothetical protein